MKRFILVFFFIFIFRDAALPPGEGAEDDLESTIAYLLNYVSESECIFIRNGREHEAEEASRHMKRKYEHYKKEIKTPEDFIRLAGTKSILSGRPYMVRMKGGKEITCSSFLENALEEYRKSIIEPKKKSGENSTAADSTAK